MRVHGPDGGAYLLAHASCSDEAIAVACVAAFACFVAFALGFGRPAVDGEAVRGVDFVAVPVYDFVLWPAGRVVR